MSAHILSLSRKKILFLSIFFSVFGFIGMVEDAGAQVPVSNEAKTQVFRVATVNVYNPKLLQSEGQIELSYIAHNREGIQSDIRSTLSLVDSNDIPVQEELSGDWFSLGQDEWKQKVIQMKPLEYLEGRFSMYLLLSTGSGITLAQIPVGEVTLSGDGRYIKIIGCSLTIEGMEKAFDSAVGIGVSNEESLRAKCSVENLFSEPIKALVSLDEYSRSSSSGEKVASYTRDVQQIGVGTQIVEFLVQKNKKPQAYTQVLVMVDDNKKAISTQTEFHYVVRGEGATIQNVIFDKASYSKGDVAKINFSWTGSADSMRGIPDREYEGTPVSGSITVRIVDGEVACSQEKVVNFNASKEFFYREEKIDIDRNCMHPSIAVVAKNSDGTILDSRSFQSEIASGRISEIEENQKNKNISLALGFIAAIFVLVALILISKMRRRSQMRITIFFLVLIGAGFVLAEPRTVRADTFVFVPYSWEPFYVTVNHNKFSYYQGESAVVTSSISQVLCVNGWGVGRGILEMINPESKEINRWQRTDFFAEWTGDLWTGTASPRCGAPRPGLGSGHYYSCDTGIRTAGFKVPNVPPGIYNVDYRLTSSTLDSSGSSYGYLSIPYQIVSPPPPPPAPTLTFTASGNGMTGGDIAIPNNTEATLTWTSSNATSCTASGSWSGPKVFNTTRSEGTGNLTTNPIGYVYTLRCDGAAGTDPVVASVRVRVTPPPPPLAVPVISHVCNAAGTSVTLNYGVPTATAYYLRIDQYTGTNSSWDGSCAAPDRCIDATASPSYSGPVLPGVTYGSWVHAYRGSESKDSAYYTFQCNAPTLTVGVTATPASGTAPLNSTVTASVGGSATGTINYHFYCDGANLTQSYLAQPTTSFSHVCSYPVAGTYAPRVLVERGAALPIAGSAMVVVGAPPSCTGSVPNLAALCSGDDSGLVANTPRTLAASCSVPVGSNPKCQYSCVAPATYNASSGACELCGVCGLESTHCEGERWADNCGNANVCGPGTKDCRKFWKEVAP